jgi:NAD(P)-dependent dehydrogenase (short-subunit alcohol dehydrogenase family)
VTLPVARDLATSGIRVCTIAPGIFETPLLGGLSDATRESLGKAIPFPSRLGLPDECPALATHIVENEMLNGEGDQARRRAADATEVATEAAVGPHA